MGRTQYSGVEAEGVPECTGECEEVGYVDDGSAESSTSLGRESDESLPTGAEEIG
jgi:hypothetical protein